MASDPVPSAQPSDGFSVFVDDNFHYQDEDERYLKGVYPTYEEAVEVCKTMVREDLEHHYEAGMSAVKLYSAYTGFGIDPWIRPIPEGITSFSAWDYAKALAETMCAGA
jgi:hypothetical protein